jgi:poly(3-hydroxybutyrate) depolymerase
VSVSITFGESGHEKFPASNVQALPEIGEVMRAESTMRIGVEDREHSPSASQGVDERPRSSRQSSTTMPSKVEKLAGDVDPDVVRSPGCQRDEKDRLSLTKGRLSDWHHVKVDDPFHPTGVRSYVIYVPKSYTAEKAYPMVLDFHGFYDTGMNEAREDGLTIAAEKEDFIVVFPNGLSDLPHHRKSSGYKYMGRNPNNWNGGGTNTSVTGSYGKQICLDDHAQYPCFESCIRAGQCSRKHRLRSDCGSSGCADDKGFIAVLLQHLKNQLCIDETRVHGTGISTGAIFLYYLATTQDVGPQFASITPVEGGFILGFLEAPTVPMPVIDIHGMKDTVVPANVTNGMAPYSHRGCPQQYANSEDCTVGDDGWFYTPINKVLSRWAVANKCQHDGSLEFTRTKYDGRTGWSCVHPHGTKCEALVMRCTHSLGHTWPFKSGTDHWGQVTGGAEVWPKEFGEVLWSFVKDIRRRPQLLSIYQ